MKVFVLSSGCRYEGGTVESVHSTKESGRAAALKLVKKRNDTFDEYRVAEAAEGDNYWANHPDMTEEDDGFWSDGMDYIALREMELLD